MNNGPDSGGYRGLSNLVFQIVVQIIVQLLRKMLCPPGPTRAAAINSTMPKMI